MVFLIGFCFLLNKTWDNASAGGTTASRVYAGGNVVTKIWNNWKSFGLIALALGVLALPGCGGGSSGANTVTVLVTPASDVLIVNQSVTFTATVSGATNLNVTWDCSFTTVTVSGTTSTTSAAKPCDPE